MQCSTLRFFFIRFFLFFLLLIFVLNPYTKIGPLGFFLIPLVFVPILTGFKAINFDVVFLCFLLILISLVGVFSSFLHGIDQFVHFKVSASIAIYVLLAYAFFYISIRCGVGFDGLVRLVLFVVVLNSIVILIQVLFPPVRTLIESLLVPSGNVDWLNGFRYRGLASGGGASLSVLVPIAVSLALYLYTEKMIGVLSLFFSVFILLVSLFFIGRTGFILLPIVFVAFVFFNFSKYFFRVVLFFLMSALFVMLWGGEIKSFVVEQYGIGFYNYSFGLFLEGIDGLNEEGTVSTVINFLRVVPSTFPEVIIGYGFYGGSDFEPWTDSGYSRMFLSVGYFFGVAFYFLFFLIFRNVILSRKFLFLTIGVVLLVAEVKEPLLFSGYASRVYILLLAYSLFEYNFLKRIRDIGAKKLASDRLERLV